MLEGSDKSTFQALRVLRDALNLNKKPGASISVNW